LEGINLNICIMGFGSVGQGVARVFQMKKEQIKEDHGLDLNLIAAVDRSGAAVNLEGLDLNLLLETKKSTGKLSDYPENGAEGISGVEILDEVDYDCLIEVTPTNIEDGEPARSHILKAMQDGKHVVTSN